MVDLPKVANPQLYQPLLNLLLLLVALTLLNFVDVINAVTTAPNQPPNGAI